MSHIVSSCALWIVLLATVGEPRSQPPVHLSTVTTAANTELALLFQKAAHGDRTAAAELGWNLNQTSTQLLASFAGESSSTTCLAALGVCPFVRLLLMAAVEEIRQRGSSERCDFPLSSLAWGRLAKAHRRGLHVLQFLFHAGCTMTIHGICKCEPVQKSHIEALTALVTLVASQKQNAVSNSTHILVWLDSGWAENEVWDTRRDGHKLGVRFVRRPTEADQWDKWLHQACAAVSEPCLGGASLMDADGAQMKTLEELHSANHVLLCPWPPEKQVTQVGLPVEGPHRDQLVFVAGLEGSAHHGLDIVLRNLVTCYLAKLPPCGDGHQQCHYSLHTKSLSLRKTLSPRVHRELFAESVSQSREARQMAAEWQRSIEGRSVYLEDISFPSGTMMWRKMLATKPSDIISSILADRPNPLQVEALHSLQGEAGVEIKIIMLYRDFASTVWSHKDWDGGLRTHAQLMRAYQQMLADCLEKTPDSFWRVFPIDMLNGALPEHIRVSAITALVEFLGWDLHIPEDCPTWSNGWQDSVKQPREMGQADFAWLQRIMQNSTSIGILNRNKLNTTMDWNITATGSVDIKGHTMPL